MAKAGAERAAAAGPRTGPARRATPREAAGATILPASSTRARPRGLDSTRLWVCCKATKKGRTYGLAGRPGAPERQRACTHGSTGGPPPHRRWTSSSWYGPHSPRKGAAFRDAPVPFLLPPSSPLLAPAGVGAAAVPGERAFRRPGTSAPLPTWPWPSRPPQAPPAPG